MMIRRLLVAIVSIVSIATVITMVGCSAQKLSLGRETKDTVIIATDFPKYSTTEDLTKKADLIISGTILSSKVEELNDLIIPISQDEKSNPGGNAPNSTNVYTVYTVKVDDCYKGNANVDNTIEVKVRGGALNGKDYVYEDNINFTRNKKYVMFLATFPNSPACLLNPIQASYTDDKDAQGNFKSANEKNNLKLPESYLEKIKKEKNN